MRRTAILAALTALLISLGLVPEPAAKAADQRTFELRIYTAAEGKLEPLKQRFREHTTRLFQKHGMTVIGYWTPVDGEEASTTLVYLLAYPDPEARSAAWRAFIGDPEWKRVYEASRENGPLVASIESKLMKPTDFSPMK